MSYGDTTRTVLFGVQADPTVLPSTMIYLHTTGEPTHTLHNGTIPVVENTGTRMEDNGEAAGGKYSELRFSAFVYYDQLPWILETVLGAAVTTSYTSAATHWTVDLGSPSGGTFTLTYNSVATSAIAYNATAATVQAALEALSTIGAGNVLVTGSAGGPYSVRFVGALVMNTLALTGSGVSLTGGTFAITQPSITGVKKHALKGGVARPMPAAVQFYNGMYWRQMLGCYGNTADVTVMGNALAKVDLSFMGPASTQIPTPSIPSDTIAAYNQPVDIPQQACKIGGTAYAELEDMKFGIQNNLNPLFTVNPSTSMHRMRTGIFRVTLDGKADYPAYAGSIYEAYEKRIQLGELDVLMSDVTTIGGGAYPQITIKVPKPMLLDTSEGVDAGIINQVIKGRAKIDSSSACGIEFDFINEVTSYAAS